MDTAAALLMKPQAFALWLAGMDGNVNVSVKPIRFTQRHGEWIAILLTDYEALIARANRLEKQHGRGNVAFKSQHQ
jgi:hypothetical protein